MTSSPPQFESLDLIKLLYLVVGALLGGAVRIIFEKIENHRTRRVVRFMEDQFAKAIQDAIPDGHVDILEQRLRRLRTLFDAALQRAAIGRRDAIEMEKRMAITEDLLNRHRTTTDGGEQSVIESSLRKAWDLESAMKRRS